MEKSSSILYHVLDVRNGPLSGQNKVLEKKQMLKAQKSNEFSVKTRGGVEDTRLEAKAKDAKNPRPRPRTASPRTEPLEAKDRNARGQGQGPRTPAQAFSKKKRSSKIFFRRSPIHWRTQNF